MLRALGIPRSLSRGSTNHCNGIATRLPVTTITMTGTPPFRIQPLRVISLLHRPWPSPAASSLPVPLAYSVHRPHPTPSHSLVVASPLNFRQQKHQHHARRVHTNPPLSLSHNHTQLTSSSWQQRSLHSHALVLFNRRDALILASTPQSLTHSPSSLSSHPAATNASIDTHAADSASPPPPPTPSLLVRLCPPSLLPYLLLARLDKPVGSWLLLMPCLWSVALAAQPGHLPDLQVMALMTIGAIVMRGAGCTINDLWDRDFDRRVDRTKDRPLASGMVSVPQALTFLAAQLAVGLAVVMQLNWFTIGVAMCSMPFVIAYPLMKRWTGWPQVFLGLTFNWGAWVGWAAVQGYIDVPILAPLYAAGICWTLVYDTIYAHQDKADDILIGVKSTALTFGDRSKIWMSGFAAATMGLLSWVGYVADLGLVYSTISIAGGSMHLLWQLSCVDLNSRTSCHRMFVSNVRFAWIILLGIVLDRLVANKKEKERETEEEDANKQHEGKATERI